jgi:alpha-1,6-mannosyltransferase
MKYLFQTNKSYLTLLCGTSIATCSTALWQFPALIGAATGGFLAYFLLASAAYLLAALRLEHDRPSLAMIWVIAVLMRLILLGSPDGLSTDVYRYAWDAHLTSLGVNPYTYAVNSAALDAYTVPLRSLVDHAWMASPYLPAAQAWFAAADLLAPLNLFAFRLAAVLCDLGSGLLVMLLLRQSGLPGRWVLLYLWNPLVAVEFSVSAHLDAWMLLLTLSAFWFLIRAETKLSHARRNALLSAAFLGAATLTKGLPVLLAPLFLRRWRWSGLAVYGAVVIGGCLPFAAQAGWGLSGTLDGQGLFGAVRIYMSQWNYNSGLYHWLETWLTGYHSAGGVPLEAAYLPAIQFSRGLSTLLIGLGGLAAGVLAWRADVAEAGFKYRSLKLMRLASLPIGAYLLFTHTIHPWYVILILPFVPFLFPGRAAWPWLYLSCAVAVSYLTYFDPLQPREFAFVRNVEYLPFFALSGWAAWPILQRRWAMVASRIPSWKRVGEPALSEAVEYSQQSSD